VRTRLDGDDEIATTSRALDDSIRNLNLSLRTILESARSIGSASREIALGRAGLPARAGVRASLEQTTELDAGPGGGDDGNRGLGAPGQPPDGSGAERGPAGRQRGAPAGGDDGNVRRTATRMDGWGAHRDPPAHRAGGLALSAAFEAAQGGAQAANSPRPCEVRALAGARWRAREARELARGTLAAIEGGTGIALDAGSSMAILASSVQAVGDIVNRIGSPAPRAPRTWPA
jgi:hypothetical protein